MYIYTCTYTCVCIYMYIYIERERDQGLSLYFSYETCSQKDVRKRLIHQNTKSPSLNGGSEKGDPKNITCLPDLKVVVLW